MKNGVPHNERAGLSDARLMNNTSMLGVNIDNMGRAGANDSRAYTTARTFLHDVTMARIKRLKSVPQTIRLLCIEKPSEKEIWKTGIDLM